MRKIEGEKIAQDLKTRIDEIEEKVEKISTLSTGLIEDYVVKLNTRIKELLKDQDIDESRLAKDVSIESVIPLKVLLSIFKTTSNKLPSSGIDKFKPLDTLSLLL